MQKSHGSITIELLDVYIEFCIVPKGLFYFYNNVYMAILANINIDINIDMVIPENTKLQSGSFASNGNIRISFSSLHFYSLPDSRFGGHRKSY